MTLGEPVDGGNLGLLTALRHDDPGLTVLISVGGWLWSSGFSDAARTEQSRKVFVDSAMEFVTKYGLDGLDVDWEYPAMAGASTAYRLEDTQNFTLLMKELRERLDAEGKKANRRMYLTMAAGAFDEFLLRTEMGKVQEYVDTVNLMSYDYYEAGTDLITGNHAPLFADPADPKKASADSAVRSFEKAGVPAEKILLGVPFYGREWGNVQGQNHGLFQPGKTIVGAYAPYNLIASTMLNKGFTRYWDKEAAAPSLYNANTHIFVSYEDPESLTIKGEYVLKNKLGGMMFWEYFGDSSGALLGAIDAALKKEPGTRE